MAGDLRRLIDDAAKLGFEFRGHSGANHLQFVSGQTRYTTALTPSCPHAWRNALRDMEKISGRTLPKQKSGKHPFKKAEHLDLRRSVQERAESALVDGLLVRAAGLRAEFREIAERGERRDIDRARLLLREFERIRGKLAEHHRILDPIY